jgi:PIN domain nuclease of toxin-antitoxin system
LRFLLDTHALIWARQDDARLGTAAREALARNPTEDFAVADVTLLEVAMLLERDRLRTDLGSGIFLRELVAGQPVLSITPEIADFAVRLALPQADPFDRVIAATAKMHGLTLVTRDRRIRESGLVPTVW